MSDDKSPTGDRPPRRNPIQFTLRTLFLLTALSTVLFLALGGMVRHSGEGDMSKGQFVLITLMAPVGLVLLLAGLRSFSVTPNGSMEKI